MKLEELDMTEEDIAEAGERIDTVVERFRATAGPECYIWKLKYIDDNRLLDELASPGAIFGAFVFVMIQLLLKNYLIVVTFVCLVAVCNISARIARGRILKEKVWKNDYVSNEDILYLCQNRALSIIIHNEVEDGVCYTHSFLSTYKDRYLGTMRGYIERKKKREFLEQIKQQHS